MNNTGLRLASVITDSLTQSKIVKDGIGFSDIQEHIYKCVQSLADNQIIGDWLETPTGATYTLTFKPKRNGDELEFP